MIGLLKNNYKGLQISALGLGCMRLPKINPEKDDIDYKKAEEMVDYAYFHGVNYFDTAYVYHGGKSEEFVGHALKKYPRESYYIATKMPIWSAKSPEDFEHLFATQLKRLDTDYIDFYLFHSLGKGLFQKAVDFGLYDFLTKKKREGTIRYLGFSFHDAPPVLETICSTYEWDFAQIQLNYVDWIMQDAKQQYEILEKYNLPCIVMEPVRGGALANPCETANNLFLTANPEKSIASWAIRYAASFPNVLTVLSGMSNMQQIIDNINTMTHFAPINNNEFTIIEKAAKAYIERETVPCTGCRYCMDCPSGVDIPGVFAQYNVYAVDKNEENYKKNIQSGNTLQTAGNCIFCGQCLEHCPQAIEIPEKLNAIKDFNEKLINNPT